MEIKVIGDLFKALKNGDFKCPGGSLSFPVLYQALKTLLSDRLEEELPPEFLESHLLQIDPSINKTNNHIAL